jgi:hypothetical protein
MTPKGRESKDFVEQAAEVIRQRGLRLPALVILESFKPFAFLGGQLLWVLQPTLSLFASRATVGELARLLEDANSTDALIARLDVDKTLEGGETPWI